MICKCKLFSVSGIPASDGSIIPREALETYLMSDDYRNAIQSRKMLGSLTHRARDLANAPASAGSKLTKTVGKDDMMLMVGVSAPTHYVTDITCENDGWAYAVIRILEETGMDDESKQYIRRLKGLLSQGIHPGVSAVVVAYWDSTATGTDVCRKIQSIKSLDITLNPSWKDAQVTEVIYEDGDEVQINYSAKDFQFEGVKTKTFSDVDSLGCGDLVKSSKIDGSITKLKIKEFSSNGSVFELEDASTTLASQTAEVPVEKTFSAANLKERLRFAKMSPRMRFRRLILDYRQLIKQSGGAEKMDEITLKVLKSLFVSDILDIMKNITPDVLKGKQINTLIGASNLGKGVRIASQKLQMPLRFAMQESAKQGYVSRMRYEKIQAAYLEFINSLIEDVFGPQTSKATIPGEEIIKEDDEPEVEGGE